LKTAKKREETPLARNLKSRRAALGYNSAEKFAEAAGMPYPSYRGLEQSISQGSRITLEPIAKALRCTIDDLLSENTTENPAEKEILFFRVVNSLGRLNEEQLRNLINFINRMENPAPIDNN